ncbi:MAG: helix-turn-helix protein [Conexibacter sp.]|jgi:excisionase family DNA binding protein|nr:helix-turn-helix protein [Conexibacter sp.]MCW2996928.1 helix-turn-helix protein [Solirubrobacterales bacterium]
MLPASVRFRGVATRQHSLFPRVSLVDSPLLTPEECADLLGGIPVKTVRQYAREGRLPARKIGQHWRFVRAEIETVLSDRQVI